MSWQEERSGGERYWLVLLQRHLTDRRVVAQLKQEDSDNDKRHCGKRNLGCCGRGKKITGAMKQTSWNWSMDEHSAWLTLTFSECSAYTKSWIHTLEYNKIHFHWPLYIYKYIAIWSFEILFFSTLASNSKDLRLFLTYFHSC